MKHTFWRFIKIFFRFIKIFFISFLVLIYLIILSSGKTLQLIYFITHSFLHAQYLFMYNNKTDVMLSPGMIQSMLSKELMTWWGGINTHKKVITNYTYSKGDQRKRFSMLWKYRKIQMFMSMGRVTEKGIFKLPQSMNRSLANEKFSWHNRILSSKRGHICFL